MIAHIYTYSNINNLLSASIDNYGSASQCCCAPALCTNTCSGDSLIAMLLISFLVPLFIYLREWWASEKVECYQIMLPGCSGLRVLICVWYALYGASSFLVATTTSLFNFVRKLESLQKLAVCNSSDRINCRFIMIALATQLRR